MDEDDNRLDFLSNKISNISATLEEMKEFNQLLDELCSDDATKKNKDRNT